MPGFASKKDVVFYARGRFYLHLSGMNFFFKFRYCVICLSISFGNAQCNVFSRMILEIQNVSIHVLLQQEIALASDGAVRKYHEMTPHEEKTEVGVADSMRVGAKEKAAKLYVKMVKLLTVANPVLGPAFLHEVSFTSLMLLSFTP